MFRARFLLFFLLNSAFAFGQKAEFFFEEPKHKFPKTTAGTQLEHGYTFLNTGKEPLLITDYKVSCVCTKVFFPLKPIMPGESGVINVIFDSTSKKGHHDRTISIISNAVNSPFLLRFKVLVN